MVVYRGRSGAASGKGSGSSVPYEKEEKTTKSSSDNGWGYFDSLAKASNPDTSVKEQKEAVNQANSIAKSQGWDDNDTHKQAVNNAELMYQGEQTAGQIAAEEAVKAGQVTTTEDGITPVIKTKPKQKFTVGNMQVSERLHKLYQSLLDRGYTPKDAEKIIRLGLTEEEWADENLVDLTSGEGIRRLITKDFGAGKEYENEFLGSAGAANILNKIKNAATEEEKQRIMNDAIAGNPEGFKQMFDKKDYPGQLTLKQFEDRLVASNEGNKNFDKNYYKTVDAYWELNPAQTSGAMEDMATAYQQGNLEMTKQNTQAIQQAVDTKSRMEDVTGLASLGGGGGTGTQPVDPVDDGLMPSGTYLASQYNKALMPDPNMDPYKNAMYTTGIEQQHLAGGYWDPNTHQWVDQQGPWGTQNLWQGANPTIPEVTTMAEGGPVRAPSSKVTQGGGGLFDFKPYGF